MYSKLFFLILMLLSTWESGLACLVQMFFFFLLLLKITLE